MTVQELIDKLQEFDPSLEVRLWNYVTFAGERLDEIQKYHIYLSNDKDMEKFGLEEKVVIIT